MKKYIAPLTLARTLSNEVEPSVIKQWINIVLSLIAAVRRFLASRHYASLV